MKKHFITALLLLFVLALAACQDVSGGESLAMATAVPIAQVPASEDVAATTVAIPPTITLLPAAPDTTAATSLNESYPGALHLRSQLVAGTLKLEGTALAVTPEQATKLLPLWQIAGGGAGTAAGLSGRSKRRNCCFYGRRPAPSPKAGRARRRK